jgi:hypothetical protein
MQIISLISNDKFLSNFNISIPTDNLIDRLNDFILVFFNIFSLYNKTTDIYPINMNTNWTSQYEANWTRILHKTGFCYTFNFSNSTQLFNLEEISSDFHYDDVIRLESSYFYTEERSVILEYPQEGPKHGYGLNGNFEHIQTRTIGNNTHEDINIFKYSRPIEDLSGFHLIIHDPFEVPPDNSNNLIAMHEKTTNFLVFPEITSFDESLTDFSLEE